MNHVLDEGWGGDLSYHDVPIAMAEIALGREHSYIANQRALSSYRKDKVHNFKDLRVYAIVKEQKLSTACHTTKHQIWNWAPYRVIYMTKAEMYMIQCIKCYQVSLKVSFLFFPKHKLFSKTKHVPEKGGNMSITYQVYQSQEPEFFARTGGKLFGESDGGIRLVMNGKEIHVEECNSPLIHISPKTHNSCNKEAWCTGSLTMDYSCL